MAVTVLTPLVLTRNTVGTNVIAEFQALGSDGTSVVGSIDMSAYADHRVLILFRNAHADTAKAAYVEKGNGIQQPAADLSVGSIAAASATIIPVVVESGAYMKTSGTYKGKIIVKGASTDIQVAVVVLP